MEFQRRTWVVERIGWLVLAAIIGAALLGLFGRGLIGSEVASAEDGRLSLDYYRFWRMQSPTRLLLRFQPSAGGADRARVWLDRSYLEAVSISRVTPQPERVEAASNRLIYVFALADAGAGTAVTFEVEPRRPWLIRGRVGVVDGAEIRFSQFIYP